jgi:hypothetical protein
VVAAHDPGMQLVYSAGRFIHLTETHARDGVIPGWRKVGTLRGSYGPPLGGHVQLEQSRPERASRQHPR